MTAASVMRSTGPAARSSWASMIPPGIPISRSRRHRVRPLGEGRELWKIRPKNWGEDGIPPWGDTAASAVPRPPRTSVPPRPPATAAAPAIPARVRNWRLVDPRRTPRGASRNRCRWRPSCSSRCGSLVAGSAGLSGSDVTLRPAGALGGPVSRPFACGSLLVGGRGRGALPVVLFGRCRPQ